MGISAISVESSTATDNSSRYTIAAVVKFRSFVAARRRPVGGAVCSYSFIYVSISDRSESFAGPPATLGRPIDHSITNEFSNSNESSSLSARI